MTMRLVFIGPPGVGKGTYAKTIEGKNKIQKISTGDIFREAIKSGSELGKEVEKYLKSGQLVPDDIVIKVVKEKIKNLENFILDGYPRTIEQAKALDKIVKIDAIINIIAPKEIIIEKLSGRRICSNPKCDGNYNIADIHRIIDGIEYILPPLLPKEDMKCDKCGSPLIQREDDKPEVIEERLNIYEQQSKPVLQYYKRKRKNKIPFIEVYMNRPPEIVVEKIISSLKERNIIK